MDEAKSLAVSGFSKKSLQGRERRTFLLTEAA
jgi:hypothetical protein